MAPPPVSPRRPVAPFLHPAVALPGRRIAPPPDRAEPALWSDALRRPRPAPRVPPPSPMVPAPKRRAADPPRGALARAAMLRFTVWRRCATAATVPPATRAPATARPGRPAVWYAAVPVIAAAFPAAVNAGVTGRPRSRRAARGFGSAGASRQSAVAVGCDSTGTGDGAGAGGAASVGGAGASVLIVLLRCDCDCDRNCSSIGVGRSRCSEGVRGVQGQSDCSRSHGPVPVRAVTLVCPSAARCGSALSISARSLFAY